MRSLLSPWILCLALGLPAVTWADPPAHAPAHGYRAKHAPKEDPSPRAEIVFDSERGIHVVVGLPDVFFHEGHFYRHVDGGWQVSVRADGGWSFAASASIPATVSRIRPHPGPAKLKRGK